MKKLLVSMCVLVLTIALSASIALAAVAVESPNRQSNVCTRFDFQQGQDKLTGSRGAGTYEMVEVTGSFVTSWQAQAGDTDSDWINGLAITFPSVHVNVTFVPADGSAAIPMEIVNYAPGSTAGWLTRDVCHAIEIQYPAPAMLPVTGSSTATAIGQVIGVVLLAVALMLIAAGLWPIETSEGH